MTHLLDVNVLLALHYVKHVHHVRVLNWSRAIKRAAGNEPMIATCSITELAA